MKKLSFALLATLGMTVTSLAAANNPPPRIKADAPNRYVVKKVIRFGISPANS